MIKINNTEFQYNAKLFSAIKSKKTTQKKLAEKTNINHVFINRIIKGTYVPSPEQRRAISRALGMPQRDLF